MKHRHPEKINNIPTKYKKKPNWIRVKAPTSNKFFQTKKKKS